MSDNACAHAEVVRLARRLHESASAILFKSRPTHEQASALVRAGEDYITALERESDAAELLGIDVGEQG